MILNTGSYSMLVNKTVVPLENAPFIINGSTMIGLRPVAEAFGCVIDYVEPEKKVVILEQ